MNGGDALRWDERERALREHEERTAEDLDVLRVIRDRWESYLHEMSELDRRIDADGAVDDPGNYFVQRRGVARCEMGAYVGGLVREQGEVLDGAEREVRAGAEVERDRLCREGGGALWG